MPTWTPETKLRLLLTIISKNSNISVNYAELAAAMGPEYTEISIKQVHPSQPNLAQSQLTLAARSAYQRIKKEAGELAPPNSDGGDKVTTPKKATPRKRKVDKIVRDDEDDDEGSPVKSRKVKVEKKEEFDD